MISTPILISFAILVWFIALLLNQSCALVSWFFTVAWSISLQVLLEFYSTLPYPHLSRFRVQLCVRIHLLSPQLHHNADVRILMSVVHRWQRRSIDARKSKDYCTLPSRTHTCASRLPPFLWRVAGKMMMSIGSFSSLFHASRFWVNGLPLREREREGR